MPTFIVGIILISGFYYCHKNPYIRYKYLSHSSEAELFYFYTIKVGFTVFLISLIVSVNINVVIDYFYNRVNGYYTDIGIFRYFESHLFACFKTEPCRDNIYLVILTLFISFTFPWLRNHQISESDEMLLFEKVVSDIPDESILYFSAKAKPPIPVMVNLASGRFLIGLVYYDSANIKKRETISLIPLRSGYRDEDNNLVFTKNYAVIFSEYYNRLIKEINAGNIDNNSFKISMKETEYNRFNEKMIKVIYKNQVESIYQFDEEIYEKYFG